MKNINNNKTIFKHLFAGFLVTLVIIFGLSSFNFTSAYDFKSQSGLSTTGDSAGYSTSNTPRPEVIAGQAIQAILSFLGILFLAFMIYAGITWMTAQGDDQKSMKAKRIIEGAITGMVIVLAAYTISYFIINYFKDSVG
jgi:hypothetical protein